MKKIKLFLLVTIFLSCFTILSGCSMNAKNKVIVKFENNGQVIYEETLIKGESAEYVGEIPQKESDSKSYEYVFTGWSDSLENIQKDTTFYAMYKKINIFEVTFKNYDGTILQVVRVRKGEDAKYTDLTPYKSGYSSGDYRYYYEFTGWSESIKNIRNNLEVTAQFKEYHEKIISDKQQIINYLNAHTISSSSYIVSTGKYTSLSYTGNSSSYNCEFRGLYSQYEASSNVSVMLSLEFDYKDSTLKGHIDIRNGTSLSFSAKFNVLVSNHDFYQIDTNSLVVLYNKLSGKSLDYAATIMVGCSKILVENISDYLSSNGLPYIY